MTAFILGLGLTMISVNQATVVLFDIDGTLIDCGGAGRRSMLAAFQEVCGRTDVLEFSFAGMTDRAIVRAGLSAAARAPDDAAVDALIAVYLARLEAEVPRSAGYRVLAGVSELVLRLAALDGLAVGLGTGNVEPGARAKLRPSGLDRSFGFGGYGSDAEDRAELLEIGARRGAAALGTARESCRVVVVGDTPRDVSAAHEIGAESVAVATGGFDAATLRAAGARQAFPTLDHPDALAAILGEL